jgi:phosphatidylglycerol---prolipoprotein diacylglyceryl transferase
LSPIFPHWEPPHVDIPIGDIVIPLHGFGLLVLLGFLFGSKVAAGRARRLGLEPELINRLISWLVVGTFIGGKLGYGLLYEPDEYLADPTLFVQFRGGLSSFGGFAVCVPLSFWFFHRQKVPVLPYMDCLAHGMALGWFFGRMGCFVAHDHPGTPTEFFLGVYGTCKDMGPDVACHSMGLYEALWSLSMFGLFIALDRRRWVPGTFVLLLGASYGPVRFALDALRPVSTDPRYGPFTPAQYGAIALTLLCIGFLVSRLRSKAEEIGPPARGASSNTGRDPGVRLTPPHVPDA